MLRYIKAAFWAKPVIPGLGPVPANVAACAGMALLGLGHPGFWMLGLAMEASYLYALANSRRFRNWVDASALTMEESNPEREALLTASTLSDESKKMYESLQAKCREILKFYERNAKDLPGEDVYYEGNQAALARLSGLYLKLLSTRETLVNLGTSTDEKALRRQAETLSAELSGTSLAPAIRESKQATFAIVEKRLQNMRRRTQSLEEIASDLVRIEAQVELARDNAVLRGKSEAISGNINLASQLLDDSLFVDTGSVLPPQIPQ